MKGKVLSIIKNHKGFYGFLQTKSGNYYYDSTSVIKGNFLKIGASVEFDVIPWQGGKKTKAVNVRIAQKSVNYISMEEGLRQAVSNLVTSNIETEGFIDLATLALVLSQNGIDYKQYADTFVSFWEQNFAETFVVEKNITINNKTYPAIIAHKNNVVERKNDLPPELIQQLKGILLDEIDREGFLRSEIIPKLLRNLGINNYKDYAANIDAFIERFLPGALVSKKDVYINSKRYPKIFVPITEKDKYIEEEKQQKEEASEVLEKSTSGNLTTEQISVVENGLKARLDSSQYILGSEMPKVLEELGIKNYKAYAGSIEAFLEKYYSKIFTMQKNIVIGGKPYSSIVCYCGVEFEKQQSTETGNVQPDNVVKRLQVLLDKDAYDDIFQMEELRTLGPQEWGVAGIEMLLKAVAGFLGMNQENIILNAFHKVLIENEKPADLKVYKDDGQLLEMGAKSAIIPMPVNDYKKIFSNVQNGKQNINRYWNAIVERFWAAQSDLAVYMTCLWLIITGHDKCVDLYIEEMTKFSRIDMLPLILKVNQIYGKNNVSERLQKKIMGRCFDLNALEILVSSYPYFNNDAIPEIHELVEFIQGKRSVDSDCLMRWFHSKIGAQISEKITNYYWWKHSSNGIDTTLFKVLASVYWEYPETYYTEIVYNPSCPLFGKKEKESLLCNSFIALCNDTKNYKKAFPWVNYLYLNCINDNRSDAVIHAWEELCAWMKKEVMALFSNELMTTAGINLFRLDESIRVELENYYCETYVSEILENFSDEEELDEYVGECEKVGAQFITRWIIQHSESEILLSNEEQYVASLCTTRQYGEALKYIQGSALGNIRKIELISKVLCENFKTFNVDEEAFEIFEKYIPIETAEAALLYKVNFTEHDVIAALIAVYVYKKEWAKALYLLAPFKAFHIESHRKFVEDTRILLHTQYNVDALKCWTNHYEVVKRALCLYDREKFDEFIYWTRNFKIPNSKKYELTPRIFDKVIQDMISDGDIDACWNQLMRVALMTDNNDKQDNLRFCIIASFMGRYGRDSAERIIALLARNNNAVKGYSEYYISLWKGLLNGKYSVNFLDLCSDLIGIAPTTFWNVFYDIAVCKNHIFMSEDYEMNSWRTENFDYQIFYSRLLEYYVETRVTVYIKIAMILLKECKNVLRPEFEKYISFCNSGHDKGLFISVIVALLLDDKYRDEIGELVSTDYWLVSNEEQEILRLLEQFCENDVPANGIYEEIIQAEWRNFKTDCLECFRNYPQIDIDSILGLNKDNEAYRWLLLNTILKVRYLPVMRGEVEHAPYINPTWRDDSAVRGYLDFVNLLYRKQLQSDENKYNDAVFVRNRYIRIFVTELLREEDYEEYSDDDIVTLMSANKHFTSVYSEYESVKKVVYKYLQLQEDSQYLKNVFLFGLISNDWNQFITHASNYSARGLRAIAEIEQLTNYRDFNIQLIRKYIIDEDSVFDDDEIAFIDYCAPKTYSLLHQVKMIKQGSEVEYLESKKLISGICRLQYPGKAQKSYNYLKYALMKYPEEIKKYWKLYMDALSVTSYKKTIVVNMLDEIKRRKIDVDEICLWKPVFEFYGDISIYYLMLSERYALDKKRENALQTFALIHNLAEIPNEWSEDVENLKRFLSGQSNYFAMTSNSKLQSLVIEKDAESVSFIRLEFIKEKLPLATAGKAYKTIFNSDVEDIVKLNAYKQLFNVVNTPDDLFAVYRQAEGRGNLSKGTRITYNELIIEYGSLLISCDEELPKSQKIQILLEIFAVYQFLSDVNKTKQSILDNLKLAEQNVLETPGVRYADWIGYCEKIFLILRHPAIQCQDAVLVQLQKPLYVCKDITENSSSEMQKLARLSEWRSRWNLQANCSNYENSFVRAVDEEINRLKEGFNLSVSIDNEEIEENSIFYQIENKAESSNMAVLLDNSVKDSSARLEAWVGINSDAMIAYEGAEFSNAVELRPGDVCGQCYRLHKNVVSVLKDGDKLSVLLNIIVDNKVICNCGRLFTVKSTGKSSLLQKKLTSNVCKYETDVPAFSRSIKGFGRGYEKNLIRQYLEQQLVVIYGPSRVGKSSLMNYVSNEYIGEYSTRVGKTVVAISIADDRNEDDYVVDMLDQEKKVCLNTLSEWLRYLFISPLTIAFGTDPGLKLKSRRRCKIEGNRISDEVKEEVQEVLDSKLSVREMLDVISQILDENECEIWYLFDEFQQIVERWSGDAKELTDLCNDIMHHQNSIRVIICGSDDLVRMYQCENDIAWRSFVQKTAEQSVIVSQLGADDFEAMMRDQMIWGELSAEVWSNEALKLLYQYTGGNAICGKLFGNELIRKIRQGSFANRTKFYPSDVTQVAYELLNSEVGLVKNLLVLHNTKNLEDELPYLLFIAYELLQNKNKADVSIRRIREFFIANSNDEVENALKILIARGILKNNEEKQRYRFSTMFYFDFFKSQATESKIQLIAQTMQDKLAGQEVEDQNRVHLTDPKEISKVIIDLWSDLGKVDENDPDKAIEKGKIQNHIGTVINAKQVNTEGGRGAITEGNVITYNVQSITNTLNGILAAGTGDSAQILKGLNNLPRLEQYLPQIAIEGEDTKVSEERLSLAMENYVADMEESLEASDAASVPYASILKISEEEYEELMEQYNLPEFFMHSLKFAYQLDQLFMKGAVGDDTQKIDFSPVTIMYCKLIESMLKEYHIHAYSESFENLETDMRKPDNKNERYKWGDIGKLTVTEQQRLTIGSFVFPLYKKWAVDKIAKVTNKDPEMWRAHKSMVMAVKDIRNPSAHGNKDHRISMEQKEAITELLFDKHGFIRLIELALG